MRARMVIWLFLAASWAWMLSCDLNHDVAGVLHFAGRLLGGERLYLDMADVNPPLAFLISVPPAWASQLTGLPIKAAWSAYISILLIGSLAATSRALAISPKPRSPWLLICAAVVLGPGAAGMIGQREHLMLMALMPWAFLAPSRADGRPLKPWMVCVGTIAALAMCLKPPFLLAGMAIEAYVAIAIGLRTWIRSPAPWAQLAVCASYAALVFLAFPCYISVILPWLIGPYQSLGHLSPWEVLKDRRLIASFAAVGGAIAFWKHLGGTGRTMLLMAAAGAASAAIQGKGWPYHLLPIATFAGMSAAVLLLSVPRRGFPAIAVAAALAVCLPLQERSGWESRPVSDPTNRIEAFLDKEKGGVLVVSPMLSPLFPGLLESTARDVTPAMTAWQLQTAQACPGFPAPTLEDREAATWFRDHVAQAMKDGVDTILVDPVPLRPDCPGAETFPHWLQKDAKLAPLMAHYRRSSDIWRLQVWRRKG